MSQFSSIFVDGEIKEKVQLIFEVFLIFEVICIFEVAFIF